MYKPESVQENETRRLDQVLIYLKEKKKENVLGI